MIIYDPIILLRETNKDIIVMEHKETLIQAIRNNTVPRYDRELNKENKRLLKSIGKNLPDHIYIPTLIKKVGSSLLDEGQRFVDGERIAEDKYYTVLSSVKQKVNHEKRLQRAWRVNNSPLNVILYGFDYIGNEYKNEWIEIINEVFKVNYPPAYLGDDIKSEWDA